MEIVKYPHPALRWKSTPVREINKHLRAIVAQMFRLMYQANGIGLAANQVALPYRLFVINPTGDPDQKDQEFVFINPEITRKRGSATGEEGCLSLPELYGDVRRPSEITVQAYDLDGQQFEMTLKDLPGRVVQHESDHLDGTLFIDKVDDETKRTLETGVEQFTFQFRQRQTSGDLPGDEQIEEQLRKIEADLSLYTVDPPGGERPEGDRSE